MIQPEAVHGGNEGSMDERSGDSSQSLGLGEELRASKVRGDMGYPWRGVRVNPTSTQHSCIPRPWLQADPASSQDTGSVGIRGRTQGGRPHPSLGWCHGQAARLQEPEGERDQAQPVPNRPSERCKIR